MRKKLKDLNQANGQLKTDEKQFKTIAQIFGDTGASKFGTNDLDVFTSKLNSMPPTDLYTYGIKYGIRGADLSDASERKRVVDNLIRLFNEHVAQYSIKVLPMNKGKGDISKIMSSAR